MRKTWRSADGLITLRQADAREALPRLAEASIDLIFTDPPYGHNNNNGDLIHRREAALGRPPSGGHPPQARPIANDGPQEAGELAALLFREAARVLRCCCCCCCCCGGGGPDPQFARWSLMMDEHLSFRQQVIWDKGKMGMGWQYRRSTECVLVATRGKGKMHWYDRSRRVENIIRPGDYGIKKIIPKAGDHPTPKPVSLASHFIRLHSRGRHLVLDPFLGGGSTAEAAIQRGRRFLGFELDREHYERSIDRCKRAIVAKRQSRIPREMVAA